MVNFFEKNNIPVLEGTRKEDGGSGSDNKERCHALVEGSSNSSSFIIDSGESRNMDSIKYFFTYMYSYNVPIVQMGDDSDIHAKGIGRIDPQDWYFNNVLFVPDLAMNLLSLYQMKC